MGFAAADLEHFDRGQRENPRFWKRFGLQPDFRNATVLDVGSGWGSLCIDIARAGAKRVVGLDLKSRLVDFANAYVRQCYPDLADRVSFAARHLRDYDAVQFDYIVSKDTFEHIIDLDCMLAEMHRRLRPGGQLYAGFGPLYPSPYGDHDRRLTRFRAWGPVGRTLALVPWGHLIMEDLIIREHNRRRAQPARSMRDLGLNKLSVTDYRRAFQSTGLIITDFRTNQDSGLASRAFAVLARLPQLEKYFTHNLYCVLTRPHEPLSGPTAS